MLPPTNIKTEMHYRQILGRILRRTESTNKEAYFFMLAEPKLLEYAYRVAEDIPVESDIVSFTKVTVNSESGNNSKSTCAVPI